MQAVLPVDEVVIVEVLVMITQIRPGESSNIPSLSAFEVLHLPQSVCVKDEAPLNISSMSFTPETSQFERSALNDDAEANMPLMSLTLDTSHFDMSPLNDDAE